MASRRRRSSIELEVQTSIPSPHASVEAAHASYSSSDAGVEDVGGFEQQLEPADRGAAAWRVLLATFMFEAILFGKHYLSLTHWNFLFIGNSPTYYTDFRFLRLIRCFSKLLCEAPRIQGQPIHTSCRDTGLWHTLPWGACNGLFCQAVSTLSSAYHLDRLAVVYPWTHRWLLCKQSWAPDIYPGLYVR